MGQTCCAANIKALHELEDDIEFAIEGKKKAEPHDYQEVISYFNEQQKEEADALMN